MENSADKARIRSAVIRIIELSNAPSSLPQDLRWRICDINATALMILEVLGGKNPPQKPLQIPQNAVNNTEKSS